MLNGIVAKRNLALLALTILSLALLSGCSGMPGAPGASGQAQQGPPGLNPPPGMKTGGARTVLGTTVTAPDRYVLAVNFKLAPSASAAQNAAQFAGTWYHCQRILVSDGVILIEGIGYDKPNATTATQQQIALPLASLADIAWRYEQQSFPPAAKKAPTTAPKPGATPNAPKSAGK